MKKAPNSQPPSAPTAPQPSDKSWLIQDAADQSAGPFGHYTPPPPLLPEKTKEQPKR
jgi:hypothetical protein